MLVFQNYATEPLSNPNPNPNPNPNLWRDIPYYLKDLNTFSFAKEIKHYLLSEQYSKKFE